MRYTRIRIAEEGGESFFEDIDVALAPVDLAPPAPLFDVSAPVGCSAFSFVRLPAGWHGDWHPAPRRLAWIVLAGELEVTVSAGEVRRFRPGDVLFAEDTSGRGHVSRIVSAGDFRAVTVTLAD